MHNASCNESSLKKGGVMENKVVDHPTHGLIKDCQEAWQNYHIGLNSSHSINTLQTSFKKVPHDDLVKKCSYLERKQREQHLLLKNTHKKIVLKEL